MLFQCFSCNSLYDECTDDKPGLETDCDKNKGCTIGLGEVIRNNLINNL